MRIGLRDLRQHASVYLARVQAGETVEVSVRGRLAARLVPVLAGDSERERLVREGRLLPAAKPWQLPKPVSARPGEPASEEALSELREERL